LGRGDGVGIDIQLRQPCGCVSRFTHDRRRVRQSRPHPGTTEDHMPPHTLTARSYAYRRQTATISPSLDSVALFSLPCIVMSAAVLMDSTAQTIAAITAALM